MTPSRADAIRKLLRLKKPEMIEDLNRLAGTDYNRTHSYRWLTDGQVGPTVTLTVYLRMKIQDAWKDRRWRSRIPAGESPSSLLE